MGLKEKLRTLPNRDDIIQRHQKAAIAIGDGGGIGRFETLDLVDESVTEFTSKLRKMLYKNTLEYKDIIELANKVFG